MKTQKLGILSIFLMALLAPCAAWAQADKKENPSEVRETLIGDVVADAMRAATGADAALVNAGSLGTADPGDKITDKNLSQIVPFPSDVVVVIRLSGKDLAAALEKSVATLPRRFSGFLQVSGIAFTADPNKAGGARISGIRINGKALDPEAVYTVALTDFLSSGGSGFTPFTKGKLVPGSDELTLGEIVLQNAAVTESARKAVGSRISIVPLKQQK